MDTVVLTNQAPASQGSDTNADDTGQEDDDASDCQAVATSSTVSASESPKLGLGRDRSSWASKDPEAEASQLQALANERARALAYVGAYKLADVTEATWHEEKIVLTRHKGHFLSFMGRAVGRRTLLHPLETLFLVESGQLTLKRDGVPVSLPAAYELLLDGRDDVDQYRVYAHLLRAGYVVLLPRRTPKPPPEASPEAQSSPLGSSAEDSDDDDDDVVCHEDNDSVLDVVPVIPAKQAKTDAAELNSSVPDPAVGVSKESKRLRPARPRPRGQTPSQRPHRDHRPAPQDDGYPSALPRLPQGSAHPWSQLKGGLAAAQRTRALLGGEGALLWTGPIKPVARTLDVYLAAVDFRKTCPGPPEYRVAMVRWDEGVPTLRDLVHSSLGDGVPLVFASVDTSGQVQLFALEPLVAPRFAPGP
ncbi:hypothetical protein HPB47_026982 [Ixodes persulcatus]|uniref:Uncharacterized protein n=1 Tax=Ixodes persulcatus TaxID=34615 RepID=A0AC60PXT2_IXOPE|nr:hypothetical protein HPB47_026982 [Ixodes persulcatus]